MSKPIICVTHPRACSTVFERVFMTRDDLYCMHEPFSYAFYFGPERLSTRYANDEMSRVRSGCAEATYRDVFDQIVQHGSEGKRVFLKDMMYYWIPPNQQLPKLAQSLISTNKQDHSVEANGYINGQQLSLRPEADIEEGNPTIVPKSFLGQFHYTFLIRDPHSSIPSFYRCTQPPLDKMTGGYEFWPDEAGYDELRRGFDYLRMLNLIGPGIAGTQGSSQDANLNNKSENIEICVIDADDLLVNPKSMIKAYCNSVGIEFKPEMLNWDDKADQNRAEEKFEKWKGWHEDALNSTGLKQRHHRKDPKSEEQWTKEWVEKYGEEAAKMIRETVDANMDDYLHLKKFALQI